MCLEPPDEIKSRLVLAALNASHQCCGTSKILHREFERIKRDLDTNYITEQLKHIGLPKFLFVVKKIHLESLKGYSTNTSATLFLFNCYLGAEVFGPENLWEKVPELTQIFKMVSPHCREDYLTFLQRLQTNSFFNLVEIWGPLITLIISLIISWGKLRTALFPE